MIYVCSYTYSIYYMKTSLGADVSFVIMFESDSKSVYNHYLGNIVMIDNEI